MKFIELINVENSPLALDGWLSWNREVWGLQPQRVAYSPKGKDIPRLEGVIYLNRKGQVQMPPRNPYLPFRLITTNTKLPNVYIDNGHRLVGFCRRTCFAGNSWHHQFTSWIY